MTYFRTYSYNLCNHVLRRENDVSYTRGQITYIHSHKQCSIRLQLQYLLDFCTEPRHQIREASGLNSQDLDPCSDHRSAEEYEAGVLTIGAVK
jgi:hypothetical protein